MEYKRVSTTVEVWSAVMAAHRDNMGVFSSYSAPGGDMFGNPKVGVMLTEYGFKGFDVPLIGAETRWDIDPIEPCKRKNEITKYWLCLAVEDEE